jgi:LysR family transcriptional activator of glutamate synthase operon
MELREIKSLIALQECGSIREAAQKCNISPAAVHKHLKTIEQEMDVRLYEKGGGGLRLTEAGLVVFPFAKEVLLHHDAALAAIAEWKDGGLGRVRIGAGPSFSSYLLPPLVKAFRRRFPRIDVYVETGDSNHLMSRLRAGSLDVIFDLAAAASNDASLQKVWEWEAPTGFVSARPDIPSHCRLKALHNAPFILFAKGTLMESVIQNYLDSLNFLPNVVMRSDSAEAIKAMIRSGLGISVLFLWNLGTDPRRLGFSVVRTEAPPLLLRMALIRQRSTYATRPVNEFIQLAGKTDWKNLRRLTLDQ